MGQILFESRPFSMSLTTPALSVLSSSSQISSIAVRSAFLISTWRLSNIGGYSVAQSTASRAVHTGNNRYSSSSVRAASASQCTAVCTAFAILFSRTLRALDSSCSMASPEVATRWKWRKNIRNRSLAFRNCALLSRNVRGTERTQPFSVLSSHKSNRGRVDTVVIDSDASQSRRSLSCSVSKWLAPACRAKVIKSAANRARRKACASASNGVRATTVPYTLGTFIAHDSSSTSSASLPINLLTGSFSSEDVSPKSE